MNLDASVELYYEPRKDVLSMLGGTEWVPEMSEFESAFLCGLLRRYRPKKIVEIGIAAGGTTAIILNCIKSLKMKCIMYSIDASEKFYRNHAKMSGYIATEYLSKANWDISEVKHKFILGKTLPNVIDELGDDIDFVILDTMHILPGEILDFLTLMPRLTSSAVICLHDISLNQLTEPKNIATNVLYSNVVARKILNFLPKVNRYGASYPNIGAFQIIDNTRDHVQNLFLSLLLNWSYVPCENDLEVYRQLYKESYSDELLKIFDNAVIYNKPHEKYIFPFEKIPTNSRVVLYGAGDVGKSYYQQIKNNDNICIVEWVDRNYENFRNNSDTIPITNPDLISPNVCDYIVIAIWQEDIARKIEKELLQKGFCKKMIIWTQHI